MAPPEDPDAETIGSGDLAPAVFVRAVTLTKRADFLRAARARHKRMAGMVVQARPRHDDDPVTRVGFTCSRKVGNAVARNRAKRRLRAVARLLQPRLGLPGWDYVLIGRADITATRPFEALGQDLAEALVALHRPVP
jgi:ribonuclease P protein component